MPLPEDEEQLSRHREEQQRRQVDQQRKREEFTRQEEIERERYERHQIRESAEQQQQQLWEQLKSATDVSKQMAGATEEQRRRWQLQESDARHVAGNSYGESTVRLADVAQQRPKEILREHEESMMRDYERSVEQQVQIKERQAQERAWQQRTDRQDRTSYEYLLEVAREAQHSREQQPEQRVHIEEHECRKVSSDKQQYTIAR